MLQYRINFNTFSLECYIYCKSIFGTYLCEPSMQFPMQIGFAKRSNLKIISTLKVTALIQAV